MSTHPSRKASTANPKGIDIDAQVAALQTARDRLMVAIAQFGNAFDDFDVMLEAIRQESRPAPTAPPVDEEYETRSDGVRVRKDRWETGFRSIVSILVGPRAEFEIDGIVKQVEDLAKARAIAEAGPQFPPASFEQWFAAIEAGDGSIRVPESIADGDAWHEHIGRRQLALGAWIAATEAARAPAGVEGVGLDEAAREALSLLEDLDPQHGITRQLRDALAAHKPAPAGASGGVEEWHPIATVPRDGTRVCVWMPDQYATSARYRPHSEPQATHWTILRGPDASRHGADDANEETAWREGWAMAYSGADKLYGDDGELQDSSERPFIDWRRDSAMQIRKKIAERGNRALYAAQQKEAGGG